DARAPMQYIDLMGGHKPHIMVSHRNNMGKTTRVDYKSSTHYYLDDKKAGTPWITKLPFPVHCISRVEVIDEVTDLHFITTYSYHHGYYDHIEKEFRGFGRVDQLDTEDYQYLKNKGASNATDIKFHEPPVLTRTWTHTGAFVQSNKVLHQFEKEYWYNNHAFTASITEHSLNDAELPAGLTMPEKIEAYRACKGMILRSETFALDGSVKEKIPYSVVTHNCIIRMLQARGSNQHAIFLVHESESITFSYERKISDPRIAHSLNLEIDQYGNVLKSVSVVYGRKADEADRAINDLEIIKRFTNTVQKQDHVNFLKRAQTQRHVIYTETKVTTDQEEIIDGKKLKYYRLPQPWSVRSFEVSNISTLNPYLGLSDFAPILSANVAIKSYHETFDQQSTQIQLRLIEHMQTLLLGSDLESPLPAGRHGAMGMTYESYQLAFTPALIDLLFNIQQQGSFVNPKRVTDSELELAKYCHIDHDHNDLNWWIRSGTTKYFDRTKNETRVSSANRYYVPIMYTDPF
ncbi:MAG: toxin TcdB middle/C-terminal domain-containing protein, partial [Cyclobacteriaceae bacterium]